MVREKAEHFRRQAVSRRGLVLLGVLAGCGGPSPGAGPQPADAFVAYRFEQRMPEDGSVLEGQFIITRDTIIARSVAGPCEYDTRETSPTLLVYQCGPFKLRFDRSDPVHRVSYVATVMVRKPQPICRGTDRTRCDPANVQDVRVPESRSGPLHAIRIGS